jgi:hypothetical protein
MAWLKRTALIAAWALSLVIAGSWGRTQAAEPRPSRFPLMTGEDFGFRVDHMKVDRSGNVVEAPSGTFVVRINGSWYTAQLDKPR